MTDFVSDGQPFETPLPEAAEGYAATPPTFARGFAAMVQENSTLAPLSRFVERSEYDTSGSATGMLGRALAVAGETAGGAPLPLPAGLPDMAPQPSPMLSADEANARYAPMGPDGTPAPITDAPIPEGVAQLIGQAKSDEIERESVLQRFSATRSLPVTFGSNVAAFLLDPLNAATSLVPAVGEDAILGGLGRAGLTGFAARTLARAGAGAIGGAAAQAPLTALRYGLGQQEASDYDFRDALRDVALSAAGGAIMQAGFGALGDALRTRSGAPAQVAATGETPPVAAASVAGADAATKGDAMRAAVAQITDGREVDVEPVFAGAAAKAPRGPARPEDIVQFLASSGGVKDQGGELSALDADKQVLPFRGRLVREDGMPLDYAREAAEQQGYLPQGSTIADFLDAIDSNLRGEPVFAARDQNAADAWREWQRGPRRATSDPFDPYDPNEMFADLADDQAQLYRDGYAQGIPQDEFEAEREAIYGGDESAARTALAPAAEATETDRAIADAERELAAGAELHPEDEAELARTAGGIDEANAHGAAYQEAASCLAGGGA